MPKVSVITPMHNSERFILHTIQSVQEQSLRDWEMLIVDDFSTDASVEIVKKVSAIDERVRLIKNDRNLGAAGSRNRGIAQSKGCFIAFLDADDLWCKDKLKVQCSYMESSGCTFSFTPYEVINQSGVSVNKTIDLFVASEINYWDLLAKKATVGCSTVMISKQFIGSRVMPDIRTGQDYAFWLQLLKPGEVARKVGYVGTKYRLVRGSISRNKFRKALRQWEIYRRIEGINLLASAYYFFWYAIRATFR